MLLSSKCNQIHLCTSRRNTTYDDLSSCQQSKASLTIYSNDDEDDTESTADSSIYEEDRFDDCIVSVNFDESANDLQSNCKPRDLSMKGGLYPKSERQELLLDNMQSFQEMLDSYSCSEDEDSESSDDEEDDDCSLI